MWTSTTTIIYRVSRPAIINCPVKQSNKQFSIIIQKKIYDKSPPTYVANFFCISLSFKFILLSIPSFARSFVRSPLQLCFLVFLPVSDPRGVSYATCCSCMAYSWKSSSKIFNRPIFLLHLFRVFFAISSSLSSSSFSNSSRFCSSSSPLCIFRLFVDFCIPCLSFQIYSSAIHKYGGWAFLVSLVFVSTPIPIGFARHINGKCFILATFYYSCVSLFFDSGRSEIYEENW